MGVSMLATKSCTTSYLPRSQVRLFSILSFFLALQVWRDLAGISKTRIFTTYFYFPHVNQQNKTLLNLSKSLKTCRSYLEISVFSHIVPFEAAFRFVQVMLNSKYRQPTEIVFRRQKNQVIKTYARNK